MQVSREQATGIYTVHACNSKEVVLNSPNPEDPRDEEQRVLLQNSFVITPEQLRTDWPPGSLEQVKGDDLTELAKLEPEVLLLGTGKALRFPATEQLAALIGLGVGYELMNTAAACRTYNILASEGRKVAAAIILEPQDAEPADN